MFKRKPERQRAAQPSSPPPKGETPPTPASRPAESRRVEPRGVPAPPSPSGANRGPSREQIATDAYYRWLARGKPFGTDWEDWFEAERRLAATR